VAACVDLPFHKYQALGNDFVLLDMRTAAVPDPAALSALLCRRTTSIGADGLILVGPDEGGAARMEFYNPDGSRAAMCGNGIRCVARFLRDRAWETADRFDIMTDVGPREVRILSDGVAADLGAPEFAPENIPIRPAAADPRRVEVRLEGGPDLPPAVCLSIGNPHCVFFVPDAAAYPVAAVGPRVERHALFPARINVIFAQESAPGVLACRVWERGAGETRACGTGAAAAVIAATVRGMVDGAARVRLPGGVLDVAWDRRGGVVIAGAAEDVFRGTISIPRALATLRSRRETAAAPRVS
jgi:diaminopimelate epimerase